MPEKTERICPKCYKPGLLFSDDPDQEGWGSSGEWSCSHCGYFATDSEIEFDEFDESDDEDWDDFE